MGARLPITEEDGCRLCAHAPAPRWSSLLEPQARGGGGTQPGGSVDEPVGRGERSPSPSRQSLHAPPTLSLPSAKYASMPECETELLTRLIRRVLQRTYALAIPAGIAADLEPPGKSCGGANRRGSTTICAVAPAVGCCQHRHSPRSAVTSTASINSGASCLGRGGWQEGERARKGVMWSLAQELGRGLDRRNATLRPASEKAYESIR